MRSLQSKMVLLFSTLILAATLAIGLSIYTSSVNLVKQSIGKQAMAVANHTLSLIDPAVFEAMTADKGETEAYKQLRSKLNEIREANGLKYLYTMRKTNVNGKPAFEYVVDGMPIGSPDASPLGKVEEENFDGIAVLFETGEPQLGELDNTADYGIQKVADQFGEVSNGSQQISGAAEEVTASVVEVTDITRSAAEHFTRVSEASEEQRMRLERITQATSELNRMADDLNRLVNKFKA